MNKEVKEILNSLDTDNMSELLSLYSETEKYKAVLDELLLELTIIIKSWLKKKEWDHYNDDKTDISVSIAKKKTKDCNWTQANILIQKHILNQITNIKEKEVLQVVNSEEKAKLKKMMRKK